MRRKVEWSRDALDDFKREVRFISAESPRAGARVASRVREIGAMLREPVDGRQGRVAGTLELPIPGLPYILAYAVARSQRGRQTVTILRLIHGARHWLPGTWPED